MYSCIKKLLVITFPIILLIMVFLVLISLDSKIYARNNEYYCNNNPPYSSTPNNGFMFIAGAGNQYYCGETQYCDSNYSSSPIGNYPCINIVPGSCKCQTEGEKEGKFACNGANGAVGSVVRSCGPGLVCNDKGSLQGGYWPCSQTPPPPPTIKCPTGSPPGSFCATQDGICKAAGFKASGTCGSNYICCVPTSSTAGGTVCGNGKCESGETSSSCPKDCGSSSGGGGGNPPPGNPPSTSSSHIVGYLDPLNSSKNWCSQITGWACDTKDPSKAVQVDLYAPNPYSPGVHSIAHVMANTQSRSSDEAAIAGFCGAATGNKKSYAHRFSFTLPANLKNNTAVGVYVYAHSLDGKTIGQLGNSAKVTCSATTPGTSPSPSGSAKAISLQLAVSMPGMGQDGGNPAHAARPVTVELYADTVKDPGTSGTTPVKKATAVLKFDNGSDNNAGYFVSTNPVSFQNVPSGNYQILVKVPQALFVLAVNPLNSTNNHVFALTTDSTFNVPPITLLTGDIATENGGLNHLNINDYNTLLSCFGDKADTSSCPVKTNGSGGTNLADLNDDGKVDGIDLNIFLRSFQTLRNANASGCEQFDCQGD